MHVKCYKEGDTTILGVHSAQLDIDSVQSIPISASRMEVEVRVVRARVWLPSSLFLRQDGFLSLSSVGAVEHVAHATLRAVEGNDGESHSIEDVTRQHKHFRTITVAWEEQGVMPGSSCPKFSLPETPKATKANHQVVLPRLDFQLFALKSQSRGASARSRPQTTYIGASGWQLTVKDVEALVSSREVVFLTTLQDDVGTLEVKLRCVSPSDSRTTPEKSETRDLSTEDVEAPSGFNINWSSSEALQKDMAEKARLKIAADKKLIAQLKQTASKAAQLVEARKLLVVHFHRSQAASIIQCQFRKLLHKQREALVKLRREEEARIAAKKAKVRENVMTRNRQRAIAMRARLLAYMDNNNSYDSKDASPERRSESELVAELMKVERTKLTEKLALLESQRRELVRGNQRSPQRPRDKIFDFDLIRAVQDLHFSRTHASNQFMQQ